MSLLSSSQKSGHLQILTIVSSIKFAIFSSIQSMCKKCNVILSIIFSILASENHILIIYHIKSKNLYLPAYI